MNEFEHYIKDNSYLKEFENKLEKRGKKYEASVVIPAYNEENTIKQTLESLELQDKIGIKK